MSVAFKDYRIEVKAAIDESVIRFLHEASGEVQAVAMRNSRVDTGKTRGSYEYQVDDDSTYAEIGSDMENAIWEEFGTGEYAISGGRKGGWTYKDAKGQFHHTSGKTPNRPLQRAFEDTQSTIISMAESIIGVK